MPVLLFNTDGRGVSGIKTFCDALMQLLEGCRLVSLNVASPPDAGDRELTLPPAESHDQQLVADRVLAWLPSTEKGDWAIIPNVGDVCYGSALILKNRLWEERRVTARIIGVCHSDFEPQYRVLETYAMGLSGVLGVSDRIVTQLRRRLGGFEGVIERLDCPVWLEGADSAGSEANRDGRLELLYLGRLEATQKRVDRLAPLVDLLLERGVSFRLSVVGDGTFSETLRRDLGEVGRRHGWGAFEFYGALGRADVVKRLRRANALLMVSEYEGTPLALLEAMSVGVCPVVMRVESGISEVLVNGENGVMVDQGDLSGMAECLERLERDRPLMRRLGAAGARYVRERYSIEACSERVEALVQRIALSDPALKTIEIRSLHDSGLEAVMRELLSVRPSRFGIYGAGILGRRLIDRCCANGLPAICLFDGDERKWVERYRGVECLPPEAARGQDLELVVIASVAFADAIQARLEACLSDRKSRVRFIRMDSPTNACSRKKLLLESDLS